MGKIADANGAATRALHFGNSQQAPATGNQHFISLDTDDRARFEAVTGNFTHVRRATAEIRA